LKKNVILKSSLKKTVYYIVENMQNNFEIVNNKYVLNELLKIVNVLELQLVELNVFKEISNNLINPLKIYSLVEINEIKDYSKQSEIENGNFPINVLNKILFQHNNSVKSFSAVRKKLKERKKKFNNKRKKANNKANRKIETENHSEILENQRINHVMIFIFTFKHLVFY
jgi:hypothetical protein